MESSNARSMKLSLSISRARRHLQTARHRVSRVLKGGYWRVPYVPQLTQSECGAACLAMLMTYNGRRTSVAELRDFCASGRDGLTAATLATTASQFGFTVRGYSAQEDALQNLPLPAIIHWSFNHFVVLESSSQRRSIIVDPRSGRQVISASEFSKQFTGVVLTLAPNPQFQRRSSYKRPSLWRYFSGALFRSKAIGFVGHIVAASLLLQGFSLVVPLFMKILVDDVLQLRH